MKWLLLFLLSFVLIACVDISHQSEKENNEIAPVANTNIQRIELTPIEIWQQQVFSGSTTYSLVDTDGRSTIKAQSVGAASMLLQQLPINLNETPFLNWQWKISNTLAVDDEKKRAGDDYSARIYIAVKNNDFSIYPRALNYVWANHSPVLSKWENPYSQHVIMFALQSGETNAEQWVSEKRHLQEDLKQVFGQNINTIEGIAIMTDTDNSQLTATAFYRDIYFSSK